MPIIRAVSGREPTFQRNCYLAKNAVITGDVKIKSGASLWYHAVVRGDVLPIEIGACTNVQDHVMIHTSHGRNPVKIGDYVTIGHRAIVHGCRIDDEALIGMGAVLLDDAWVGKGAVVAAGAVVLEGTHIKPGELYAGVPAKLIRADDAERQAEKLHAHAQTYVDTAGAYAEANARNDNTPWGLI